MLTAEQQIESLRTARDHLIAGSDQTAHSRLLEAIHQTPSDSPHYGAMVGAANWLKPLYRPDLAAAKISEYLLNLATQELIAA